MVKYFRTRDNIFLKTGNLLLISISDQQAKGDMRRLREFLTVLEASLY
jgi:hypothetical protein